MVRAKGPLMSMTAQKQLAKSLIYKQRGHRSFITGYGKPGSKNPFTPSALQLEKRARYGLLVGKWKGFSQGEKDVYNDDPRTDKLRISGFNLFIKLRWIVSDPDVQIWINAVESAGGSLTDAEKTIIDTYVIDAKDNDNDWWDDTLADYPMVGGNESGFAINLKNPGTFDITFEGVVAGDFTSTGWKPNGLTAVAKTGFISSVELTLNSTTIEYYSRDSEPRNSFEMGARVSGTQVIQFKIKTPSSNDFHCDMYQSGDGRILFDIGAQPADGSYVVSRIASNSMIAYRNGVSFTSIATTAGTLPNIEMYIAALNSAGTPTSFSPRECAGALIGDGFTSEQVLAQYNARQAMNVSLNREI